MDSKRSMSAGSRFREALKAESPLQIVGTINALSALLAEQSGFQAIYLSGAGVANASYGMPDLGVTSLQDVLIDASRITSVTEIPLLVDVDTGWGTAIGIERTVKDLTRAGVAAIHMEDQVAAKRCGHRPNKVLVETSEMVDRVLAAVNARNDESFFVIARTDAVANEGLDAAIERANAYVEAGADGIFAEAITKEEDFETFCNAVKVPVLANMTEFGKTPLMTIDQLKRAGVAMTLYPLSAFRAMNRAAERTYAQIRQHGTQEAILDQMQTRAELYQLLGYEAIESRIDRLLEGKSE